MKVLYFIPARGGSKGLPGKNIKPLCSKPLIAHTIEAALSAKVKGDVIVSTDSKEIAEISVKHGAEVPFLRPPELALDDTPTMDVLFNHLHYFENKEGIIYDVIVLLQPTSPLRTSEDINSAFELFSARAAGAVVSVCECDHHPLWSNELPEDGSMKHFLRPEVKGKNRQQLPKYFMLNGAIYIGKTDYLLKNKGFMSDETIASIMSREHSVDIDSEADFFLAEYFKSKQIK
ncbi:MAG TPA: acylneuraminate cytidylyltransferase family protein [Bacteroidia bacterium]|jgi:N-acylneuraminate cytidylyltransferase/CMP-N,N'-diacetyllegionaminic acid synthase